MRVQYAQRIQRLQDTELLRLMQLAEAQDMISFAGGFPAPELFPIDQLKEITYKVLQQEGQQAFQYASTSGYLPLREQIASRMSQKHGVSIGADEILITSGSQQALDMSAMIFLDEGDVVLCERPSYLGAINAFKAYGARFIEVPTDDDGMNLEALEKILDSESKNIKLVYVIPDFQNPTGRCWSIERRKGFINIMNQYDIPIIEDAAYSELAFNKDIRPSLCSLDQRKQVIYLGSFSKVFCPGLRVAWVYANPEILSTYTILKPNVDLSTSNFSQRQISYYLKEYDLDEHIDKICKVYKQRRDLALGLMQELFPKEITFTRPKGGLFSWVTLPKGKSTRELLEMALKRKVAFVPGGSFYPNGGKENDFRLNYSNMSEEKIVEGLHRLSDILVQYLC